MLLEHIRLFFDEPWVRLMEDLRSPEVRLPDGSWHRLELHSGMGNGYTFEVESLLFWAIAQSCCELYGSAGTASVYGDDVIVPQDVSTRVVDALEGFGFRINSEKSFLSGRFYESCGKHFFDVCDVTPVYEKSAEENLSSCIRSYNRLYRWCFAHGLLGRFRRTLVFLELRAYQALLVVGQRRNRNRGYLRPRNRGKQSACPKVPYQALWMPGDGGLITEDTSLLPDPDENGIWELRVWTARPLRQATDGWSMYSDSLRRESRETASYGLVTPRDRVKWGFSTQRYYRWDAEAVSLSGVLDAIVEDLA